MSQMSQTGDERLICEFTTKPFTGHRKRHISVNHQFVLNAYPDGSVDIRHLVRCPERGFESWTEAEAWEIRDHGIERVPKAGRWWA